MKPAVTTLILVSCSIDLMIAGVITINTYRSNNQSTSVAIADRQAETAATQRLQTEAKQLRKQLASAQGLVKKLNDEVASLSLQLAQQKPDMQPVFNDDTDVIMQAGKVDEQAWEDEIRAALNQALSLEAFSRESEEHAWEDKNMTILDEAFNNEAPDPEWSPIATENIHELLQAEAFDSSDVVEANCAATLCRIETYQKNSEKTEQFLNQFGFLTQWQDPEKADQTGIQTKWSVKTYANVIVHEGGGQTVVYYLSRDGHELPPMEN